MTNNVTDFLNMFSEQVHRKKSQLLEEQILNLIQKNGFQSTQELLQRGYNISINEHPDHTEITLVRIVDKVNVKFNIQ